MRHVVFFKIGMIFLSACYVLASQSYAQSDPVGTATISEQNLRDFDFMVEKISTNYAGYDTKIAGGERQKLASLTERLRNKAPSASRVEMAALMTEWIGFFQDEHTQITALSDSSASRSSSNSVPRLAWTEAGIRKKLHAIGQRRNPVEGIWSIDGDRYRLAVVRGGSASTRFSAVVLSSKADNWIAGMVKADIQSKADGGYSLDYRTGNFATVKLAASLEADGAIFDTGDYGVWRREWPAIRNEAEIDKRFPANEFFIRRLSAKTIWLRVPNFHDDNAAVLSKLLKDNAQALGSTRNLIIDARRNGGGSDVVYGPLMPYLYTRPIYSIGMEMRASADNVTLRRAVADRLRKNPEGLESAKELDAQNLIMEKHPGSYVQTDSRPFSILNLGEALQYPKRVVVLIDLAGSSGEEFLLAARQSGKVTLMGQQNSRGVLDFANVVSMPSPTGRFELQWATSRSLRLPEDPVDNGGIKPDVRIPASASDLVSYAQNWLEMRAY